MLTHRVPEPFEALRVDAAHLLTGWAAPSASLERLRERLLQTAQTQPACMWRDGAPVHFTAGLVVLNPELTHVALTLHSKAKRWFQFGGHFEACDVSVAAAAFREGQEESGLLGLHLLPGLVHIDAHELPRAFGSCHEHLDLRFAAVSSDPRLVVSDESDDVRWWSIDTLPEGTETSLRQAIDLSRRLASADTHRVD